MENRLNKKVEEYVSTFKQDIKQYISTMSTKGPELDKLIEYIYDYERLYLIKDDFQKRKRVKAANTAIDKLKIHNNNEMEDEAIMEMS